VLNEGGVERLNGSDGALPLHARLRFRTFLFPFHDEMIHRGEIVQDEMKWFRK
jgi:hypothetical protein